MGNAKPKFAPDQWAKLLTEAQVNSIHYLAKGYDVGQISQAMGMSVQAVGRKLLAAAVKLERGGDSLTASRVREALKDIPQSPKPKYAPRSRKHAGIQKVSEVRVAVLDEPDPKQSISKEVRTRIIPQFISASDKISRTRETVAENLVNIKKLESQSGIDTRWNELEKFARRNNGIGVAARGQELFPELAKSSSPSFDLPTQAPEIYQGRRGPDTPPEFVQRVYGQWLGRGLTRAHIRNLDPKLYTAIDNWLKKPGCDWPSDVDLPTLKEQNDRDVARLSTGDGLEILGRFTGKEAARLGAAISRRTK